MKRIEHDCFAIMLVLCRRGSSAFAEEMERAVNGWKATPISSERSDMTSKITTDWNAAVALVKEQRPMSVKICECLQKITVAGITDSCRVTDAWLTSKVLAMTRDQAPQPTCLAIAACTALEGDTVDTEMPRGTGEQVDGQETAEDSSEIGDADLGLSLRAAHAVCEPPRVQPSVENAVAPKPAPENTPVLSPRASERHSIDPGDVDEANNAEPALPSLTPQQLSNVLEGDDTAHDDGPLSAMHIEATAENTTTTELARSASDGPNGQVSHYRSLDSDAVPHEPSRKDANAVGGWRHRKPTQWVFGETFAQHFKRETLRQYPVCDDATDSAMYDHDTAGATSLDKRECPWGDEHTRRRTQSRIMSDTNVSEYAVSASHVQPLFASPTSVHATHRTLRAEAAERDLSVINRSTQLPPPVAPMHAHRTRAQGLPPDESFMDIPCTLFTNECSSPGAYIPHRRGTIEVRPVWPGMVSNRW